MQGSFESHQRFLFRAVKEDVRLAEGIWADLQQSAGNKGSAAQGILRLGNKHAAHPREGSCLSYKAFVSN